MDVEPESENGDLEIQTLTDSPAFINSTKSENFLQPKCYMYM